MKTKFKVWKYQLSVSASPTIMPYWSISTHEGLKHKFTLLLRCYLNMIWLNLIIFWGLV